MNIGLGGAIFFWVLLLWPLIVGITYPLARKLEVSNVPALSFISIVLGYGAMWGVGLVIDTIEQKLGDLWLFNLALPILAPLVSTHLVFLAAKTAYGRRA